MSLDVSLKVIQPCKIYTANITHNLNVMAEAAGIYHHLWRPDEIGIVYASQLIEPLERALADLRARPDHYRQYNPDNGWGRYETFLQFVEFYLVACVSHPDATVEVSR